MSWPWAVARMELNISWNNIFLPENFLLENVDRIRKDPRFIVQGRYDLVCPIRSADDPPGSGQRQNTRSFPMPGIRQWNLVRVRPWWPEWTGSAIQPDRNPVPTGRIHPDNSPILP